MVYEEAGYLSAVTGWQSASFFVTSHRLSMRLAREFKVFYQFGPKLLCLPGS